MTLQVTQSVAVPSSGALTTPNPLTPAATDTFAEGSFGPQGLHLLVLTTGTLTNLGVLDPSLSDLGYAGTVPSLAGTATGHRMIFVPRSAINPATGLASVTFSGALTGVTYYALKV
jgi:hypothetical protein